MEDRAFLLNGASSTPMNVNRRHRSRPGRLCELKSLHERQALAPSWLASSSGHLELALRKTRRHPGDVPQIGGP